MSVPLCLLALPPINSFASSHSAPVSSTLLPHNAASLLASGAPENFPASFLSFFFSPFPFLFVHLLFISPFRSHYGLPHRQNHGDKMAVRQPFCGSRQWLRAAPRFPSACSCWGSMGLKGLSEAQHFPLGSPVRARHILAPSSALLLYKG